MQDMNNWTSGKKNIQDLGLGCQSDHQDAIISQPPPVSNPLFIYIVKHYLLSGSLFKFSLSCHWILIGRVLSESPCPNISLYEAFHRLGCVSHHRFVPCWAIFVFFNSPRLLSVHYPGLKNSPQGSCGPPAFHIWDAQRGDLCSEPATFVKRK